MEAMTVIRDTRERTPWVFPRHIKVLERTLKTGDYSIKDHTRFVAVERKSLGDWIASITTGWDRFQTQLNRLAKMEYSCVIVEGLPSMARYRPYQKFKATPYLFMSRAAEITASWGMPVLWSESKGDAMQSCLYFLQAARHDIRERTWNGS